MFIDNKQTEQLTRQLAESQDDRQQRRKSDTLALLKLLDENEDAAQLFTRIHQVLLNTEQRLTEKDAYIALLEEKAFKDPLTGTFNRAGLEQSYHTMSQTAAGAVIVVDMDQFKPINDTFGHGAGDAALTVAAKTLTDHVRHGQDIVSRPGGDEFVVLLRDTTPAHALEKTKHLANAFNNLSFVWNHDGCDVSIKIGASIGAASFIPGQPLAAAMKEADKRMYKMKERKNLKNAR